MGKYKRARWEKTSGQDGKIQAGKMGKDKRARWENTSGQDGKIQAGKMPALLKSPDITGVGASGSLEF
ncbi:hypothetical protein PMG71_02550 [Roseofilum sp. BLCC_M154]|uniref:Uncharacterized protein n=1 Tax=Roseofilum acuticapitatum BLCC-M154 TaxID=3022444 RepID=A0ABT7AN21_9CYAN|nr:hypothetical protein [Roseofilum acuticapitatum]MDJ1168301.1 hypothetical protein [Roseofilum acuticapitatum BLCC-M154]